MPILNKLKSEKSAYLLQHATNPINWHAWGEEPFQKAKEENKPLLVSIGYATCHWCHVMERESFENAEIAAFMNEKFVCIKVDREEHPDIDHYYMEAVQMFQQQGGWPLNVFLTYDKKPFFGGTYYPPVDAYGKPSWMKILQNISNAYTNKHEVVFEQSEKVHSLINSHNERLFDSKLDPVESSKTLKLEYWVEDLLKYADWENGGFGHGQKFPSVMPLKLLLAYTETDDTRKIEDFIEKSMLALYRGGIYDKIGGGWSRYTVDNTWKVPHFEKMLYDNAQLLGLFAWQYLHTNHPIYAKTIDQTLDFLKDELKDLTGLFYSGIDADSEGVEGKFYTWTYDQITELFGQMPEDIAKYCDIQKEGNWDKTNILYLNSTVNSLDICLEANEKLSPYFDKMLVKRSQRIRPITDKKKLTNQNALLITQLVQVYLFTENEKAKTLAVDALEAFEKLIETSTKLYHQSYDEKFDMRIEAYLDDYAQLIEAYIWCYLLNYEENYLAKAKWYMDLLIENCYSEDRGIFNYTHSGTKMGIHSSYNDIYDQTMPSGNSTAYSCLIYLYEVFADQKYLEIIGKMEHIIKPKIKNHIFSMANWALTFARKENIISIKTNTKFSTIELKEIFKKCKTSMLVILYNHHMNEENRYKHEVAKHNKVQYTLCKNNMCFAPVDDFKELIDKIIE